LRSATRESRFTRFQTSADIRNEHGRPAGKLADAELHFIGGELEGLKLVGFAIWERRDGIGRNFTFPARQFNVHGDRRNFALLRAITDPNAQDRVRELVLKAFDEQEQSAVRAVS
jgi:hypothetical protein